MSPPQPPQPVQPIQPAAPSTSKSKTGLIIGIVVGIAVLIGIIVGVILVFNNKPENKSDDQPTDNAATSNTPDEPDENKIGTLSVGYKDKNFIVSSSFSDTVRSANSSFEIHCRCNSFEYEKITDLDTYLDLESDDRLDQRAHAYILDKNADYENRVIDIQGGLSPKKQGKITPFKDFDLLHVDLESTIGSVTYSIDGYQFTTKVTTKSEIFAHFGDPTFDDERSYFELTTFERNGFTIIFEFDITDSGYVVSSATISTGLFKSE